VLNLQPSTHALKTVKELHTRMAHLFPLVRALHIEPDPNIQNSGFLVQTITAMTSTLTMEQQRRLLKSSPPPPAPRSTREE
jgi:hypothetical protein